MEQKSNLKSHDICTDSNQMEEGLELEPQSPKPAGQGKKWRA